MFNLPSRCFCYLPPSGFFLQKLRPAVRRSSGGLFLPGRCQEHPRSRRLAKVCSGFHFPRLRQSTKDETWWSFICDLSQIPRPQLAISAQKNMPRFAECMPMVRSTIVLLACLQDACLNQTSKQTNPSKQRTVKKCDCPVAFKCFVGVCVPAMPRSPYLFSWALYSDTKGEPTSTKHVNQDSNI